LLDAPERTSMKKLALALLTIALLGLPASPAMAAGQHDCQVPVPTGNYDSSHMSYALAVDYSECSWWKGRAIRLDAELARLDAEGETVADAVTLCGVGPGLDYAESPEPRPDSRGNATCEVGIELEHHGEITFPWRGATRTVEFTMLCASPGSLCRDVR
jgi:hypothetical protein